MADGRGDLSSPVVLCNQSDLENEEKVKMQQEREKSHTSDCLSYYLRDADVVMFPLRSTLRDSVSLFVCNIGHLSG